MTDFRLPNISGKTEREQIAQLKSYLYQLIPELQFALETLDNDLRKANAEIERLKKSSNGGN